MFRFYSIYQFKEKYSINKKVCRMKIKPNITKAIAMGNHDTEKWQQWGHV